MIQPFSGPASCRQECIRICVIQGTRILLFFQRENMTRIRGYKYRAYPNKEQRELFEKTFGCCRFVYNYYLEAILNSRARDQLRATAPSM